MRKLWLGLVAAALPALPLAAQDDLFGKLDANKDGVVTADEVEGDAKSIFERALRRGDKDGDKKLTKEEFAASLRDADQPRRAGEDREPGGAGPPIRRPATPEQVKALFDRTDANSDGKITKDEVPENLREAFARRLERAGSESLDQEQFAGFAAVILQQQGRPGEGRPGMGRPPIIGALDSDNDGELSAGEIEGASKALAKLDKNGDGKLTRDEMFAFAGPPPGERRPGDRPPEGRGNLERLIASVKAADKNGDTKLSKEEVEQGELPPFLKEGFARLDANSDGLLDQEELRRIGQRFREGGDRPRERRPDGERRPEGARRPDAPPRE